MSRVSWQWGALAVWLGFIRLTAAESTNVFAQPVSLADCIAIALEHNLDIKIERFNPEIARENLNMSYGAYDPLFNATANHSFDQEPGGLNAQNQAFNGTYSRDDDFGMGLTGLLPLGTTYNFTGNLGDTIGNSAGVPFENTAGAAGVALTQPLLKNFWIDAPRLNIEVSKKLLRISELGLRLQIMATVNAVEQAYDDLILAGENVKVQQQAEQLAEQLFAEDKRRVEVGALASLDEKQAESQMEASKADVLDAQRAQEAQQNVLKLLLIDNPMEWRGAAPEPAETLQAMPVDFDLNGSWQKAFAQRPDLLQSQADLDRQGVVVSFLKNQLFPELDLVGGYGRNASQPQFNGAFGDLQRGNSPFYSYGATLTVPLGNVAAHNNYKIGKATKEQSLLKIKQLELQIMAEVEDSVNLARTDLQRVEATRQSRIFAETALQAEQKKMETGKSTSFFVLQFQRDLTAARSAEIQALADYNKALAQLAFNEGSTLERNRVNLVVK